MYDPKLEFDKVYKNVTTYIHKEEDLAMIRSAFDFVNEIFKDIKRKDGSPYVRHLIETSSIVADLHGGPETVSAALLHDSIEDIENVTYETIKEKFSKNVADLVEAVTKVSSQEQDSKAKTVQKLFNLMRSDVRVLIIKIADRLNNMRTMGAMIKEKQVRISKQTLELYAPAARYFGLNDIAREMEELCLLYLDKEQHDFIVEYLNKHNKESKASIEMIKQNLAVALKSVGIANYISNSNKEVYNIYKFINNGNSIDEIQDLDIINILVEDNLDCYLTLGVVHSIYTPIIGRLKDYIASPKYNMYQAIHTVVIGPNGYPVKIAIATRVMKEIYQKGIADKWAYDESKGYSRDGEQEDIRKHLMIIKELDKINMVSNDSNTFVKILEEDIFSKNQYVYVYSSKGKVVTLPVGATALDFVFKDDEDNANRVTKILINGIESKFDTVLKNGAVVMVKYGYRPTINEEWLKMVTSNYAKMRIKRILDI